MGKSSTPASPDYTSLLAQQTKADQSSFQTQTSTNRPTVNTPQGSVGWTQTPSSPAFDSNAYLAANPDVAAAIADGSYKGSALSHYLTYGEGEGRSLNSSGLKGINYDSSGNAPINWTENETLSPGEQSLYDNSTGLKNSTLAQAQSALSTPQDFSAELGDTGTRQAAEDSLYNQQTQYLDPQFNNQESDLKNQLISQGFSPDSEAYQRQMNNFALTKQKAYSDARNSAITGSADEAKTDLSNMISRIGVQSSDRQSSLQDYLSLIGQGNGANSSLSSLLGGSSGANLGTADYLGTGEQAFQNLLNQTNAANARTAQTTSAGVGAAGAIAAAAIAAA